MKLFLPFLAILAICTAKSVENRASVDELIQNALETFRNRMSTGVGEENVILAPIQMEEYITEFDGLGLISLNGVMRIVHIAGLDGFIVNQATLNLDTLRYSFDYTVPNIVANFWYDLTGEVFSLIPIFGIGNARMEPINLSISGYADLITDDNDFVQVNDLVIRIRLENLEADIEGLLGGGDLGVLVNELFKDMLILIIEKAYAPISTSLKEIYMPRANEFMNGKTIMEILEEWQN